MHPTREPIEEQHKQVAVPIGQAVRHFRAGRKWTLDQLAARSGISRRRIVQIEQGGANPSIGSLFRLAEALGVTLSELLGQQPATTAGVRLAHDDLELWTGPCGGTGRLLIGRGPVELWSWTFPPGERHERQSHRAGSIELLAVTKGRLELGVGRDSYELRAGDSAWFEATEPRTYLNPGRSTTTFTMVVLEP